MKKLLLFTFTLGYGLWMQQAMGQDEKQPGKVESQEIIIQKRGDRDENISVQINGDQVIINGKPLSEYNNDNVTVKKKRMIITNGDKVIMESNGGDELEGPSSFFNNQAKKPFLGVSTEKNDKGAEVVSVSEGSAAEKAGLQTGDIITKINDAKIDGPQALIDAINALKPGDEVKVGYIRDNKKPKTLLATLGARKEEREGVFSFNSPDGSMQTFTFPNLGDLDLGSFHKDIPDFYFKKEEPKKQKLGIKIQDTQNDSGVKVLEVEEGSAGAAAGILKDDIITEINGHKVSNTDEARIELKESSDKAGYRITATRNGKEINFDVKLPKTLKTADL